MKIHVIQKSEINISLNRCLDCGLWWFSNIWPTSSKKRNTSKWSKQRVLQHHFSWLTIIIIYTTKYYAKWYERIEVINTTWRNTPTMGQKIPLNGRKEKVSWCCGVVVTAQLHSTKPELRFWTGSNPACSVLEIRNGDDLWQWSRLEIRLNVFHRSNIPQKQFIIIIMIINQKKSL